MADFGTNWLILDQKYDSHFLIFQASFFQSTGPKNEQDANHNRCRPPRFGWISGVEDFAFRQARLRARNPKVPLNPAT